MSKEHCLNTTTENSTHFFEQRHDHFEKVESCPMKQEICQSNADSLELGSSIATGSQQKSSSPESITCTGLLKMNGQCSSDAQHMGRTLQRHSTEENYENMDLNMSHHQREDEIKTKYTNQLSDLRMAGVNVNNPRVLMLLEKSHGDVQKVLEIVRHRNERKDHISQLDSKYLNQIKQIEHDGIRIKNRRLVLELFEKADGQVDIVKQALSDRNEQKCQIESLANSSSKQHSERASSLKQSYEMTIDDLDHLKQLRAAGLQGNPMRILAVFHECNDSIDETIARIARERKQLERRIDKRTEQRIQLAEISDAYLTLNDRNDWPDHIQKVYLDGNNLMLVIDSLRRLCLNGDSEKTEQTIAQIADAWNEQMHILSVTLVFDTTHQTEKVGSVKVNSARPIYKRTDDMFIDIAQTSENRHTIFVTSDRTLSIQLKHEGCLLLKPYQWFVHCAMVLAPDLIQMEELAHNTSTTKKKVRCDLDELVRRIVKMDS